MLAIVPSLFCPLLALALLGWSTLFAVAQPPGVLFIAAGDLRETAEELRAFGPLETPNLDRLAALGTRFTSAYAPAVSRDASTAAWWTGKSPVTPNRSAFSLPARLMQAGYLVFGTGATVPGKSTDWHGFYKVPSAKDFSGPNAPFGRPIEEEETETADRRRVDWCVDRLRQADGGRSIFLFCELSAARLPLAVPVAFYERFPLESIQLPEGLRGEGEGLPALAQEMARSPGRGTARFDHEPVTADPMVGKQRVQAYLAAVAYLDSQLGRLLDAWELSVFANTGVIIFFGDQGRHLGEKTHWASATLWRVAARVPLIIVAPGVATPGSVCAAPVSLLDLPTTLLELVGLSRPEGMEGHALLPLLRDPSGEWPHAAVTFHSPGNLSIYQGKWHAIGYRDGGRELYDLEADPGELNNLANASPRQWTTLWEAHAPGGPSENAPSENAPLE